MKKCSQILKFRVKQQDLEYMDGLEVALLDVTALGAGWFKGLGKVTTPLLGASFHVKFDRLFVDENRVAGFGRIDFLTRGVAEMVLQQVANAQRNDTQRQQEQNRSEWANTEFQEKIFKYDNIVIESISVDNNGNIIIADNSGQTYTNNEIVGMLASAPEKAIIIEDKNGDQWVVQKKDGQTTVTEVEGGGLVVGSDGKIIDNRTLRKLDRMILTSLRKYKKSIEDYLASVNQVQPSKGGGPSLFEWELEMYYADLPDCLADHKDDLNEIKSDLTSLVDSTSTAFLNFALEVGKKIVSGENATQEEVDEKVCESLVTPGIVSVAFSRMEFSGERHKNILKQFNTNAVCYFGESGSGNGIPVKFKLTFNPKQDHTARKFLVKAEVYQGSKLLNSKLESTAKKISQNEYSTDSYIFLLEDKVNRYENIVIKYYVAAGKNQEWQEVGSYSPIIYTTLKQPLYDNLDEKMLYFSCRLAKDLTSQSEVIHAIWKKFEINDENRIGGLFMKDFGIESEKRLSYYLPGILAANNKESLLTTGNGICNAFEDILKNLFLTQGIPSETRSVNYPGEGFLIKEWKFNGTGSSGDITHPYINRFEYGSYEPPYLSNGKYRWIGNPEVERVPNGPDNLSGQNNKIPVANFEFHQIVECNGKIYDPSYGKVFLNIKDWEVKAIDGFYRLGESEDANGKLVDAWLIRKK